MLCVVCFDRRATATGEPIRWKARVGCCDFAPHGSEHPCGQPIGKVCDHCGGLEPCTACWRPATVADLKGMAAEAGQSVNVVEADRG